jgi:hypothetical protein
VKYQYSVDYVPKLQLPKPSTLLSYLMRRPNLVDETSSACSSWDGWDGFNIAELK